VRDGRIEGCEIEEGREERRKRWKNVYEKERDRERERERVRERERERDRERRNVLVCRVSSLGMLGEGVTEKKRKHGMKIEREIGLFGHVG
jgi:hypothetical protein